MPFDTPIPPVAIALAGLILAALIAWSARRQRAHLPPRSWIGLLFLRSLTAILFLLLLLNPYRVLRHPDPDSFRVALMADVSGSMHAQDLADSLSRIDFLNTQLDAANPESLQSRLETLYRLDRYGFTDGLVALPENAVDVEAGLTAIGDSLEALRDEAEGRETLAAVVLLSDGISLQGESLLEAARRFRQEDIPVTVVGVGNRNAGGDVGVELAVTTADPVVNQPVELKASVGNRFVQPVTVTVEFLEGDTLLGAQEITVPAGERVEITEASLPTRAGFHSYRARIVNPPSGDRNQANDIGFATAEVSEPRVLKVLYLSNHLSDNYRFLRDALREDPDWKLHAVIRLSEERFAFYGFDEQPEEENAGFAEAIPTFYEHSVLIIETDVVRDLDETGREALQAFLTRRGGGVLFLGAPGNIAPDMSKLLPVRQSEMLERPVQLALEIEPEPVFSELAGGTLFRPPPLFLPAGKTAYVATELSLGGRVALSTRQGNHPLLSLHAYGGGRVAYLGTEATWRWRMSSEHGMRQHALFWRYLLGWLGTGGKPRLELPLQGQMRPVGEPVALDAEVRGADFRPADNAQVSATLRMADGSFGPSINLVADPAVPGRYRGTTTVNAPGEYRVDYRVNFPDGEGLDEQVWFAGAYLGQENTDLVFRERDLRDLARITGGDYYDWREVDALDELPLTAGIPEREEHLYWTRNLTFLLLLVALAGSEWILRRRIGLT